MQHGWCCGLPLLKCGRVVLLFYVSSVVDKSVFEADWSCVKASCKSAVLCAGAAFRRD